MLMGSGWRGSLDFIVFLVLLLTCALGGGSAFSDTLSLLYVRPVAVVALTIFLLTPVPIAWCFIRVPMLLLGLWALVMLLQLFPLPPGIWLLLPGREVYAGATAGAAQPWRPLSLTPDLTANSLAALVVPTAVLIGFGKLNEQQRRWLVVGLVGLCVVSAALGIVQFASGKDSAYYFYKRAHLGLPAGLLANRNHQAALLALTFPALRVWTLTTAKHRKIARRRSWTAVGLGAMIVPVILATGSRAGMVVSALSLAATFVLFPMASDANGSSGRWTKWVRWAVPGGVLLLVGLSYLLGRATSIDRIWSVAAAGEDQRFLFAPVVLEIIRRTFPVGTGLGSFDPVFRQYEPDSLLIATYFNHAHNELLELTMTAGLPGLLLLLALIGWWVICMVRPGIGQTRGYVLLGGIAVATFLSASIVDYPLRCPLLSAVFAIACGWMGMRQNRIA